MEHPDHLFSFNSEHRGGCDRRRGGHALRLNCRDTFLAQEVPGPQQGDGGFFAALGDDGQLDPALLNIKHSISGISLGKDVLVFLKINNCPPQAGFREKSCRLKSSLFPIIPCAGGSHASNLTPLRQKCRCSILNSSACSGMHVTSRLLLSSS